MPALSLLPGRPGESAPQSIPESAAPISIWTFPRFERLESPANSKQFPPQPATRCPHASPSPRRQTARRFARKRTSRRTAFHSRQLFLVVVVLRTAPPGRWKLVLPFPNPSPARHPPPVAPPVLFAARSPAAISRTWNEPPHARIPRAAHLPARGESPAERAVPAHPLPSAQPRARAPPAPPESARPSRERRHPRRFS